MPTRLPDKVKKPKWAKPRKTHGKASARAYTGAEAAEITANRAKQSSNAAGKRPTRGGTTITLALRTPERLRTGPDLAPKAAPTRVSSPGHDLAWQLPASTAPRGLGQPR